MAPGATKITQEGAPDQALIATRRRCGAQLADGRYQVVAISNPYGALHESGTGYGSVNCTTVDVSGAAGYSNFAVNQSATQLSTCLLPKTAPCCPDRPRAGPTHSAAPRALTCASLVSDTGHLLGDDADDDHAAGTASRSQDERDRHPDTDRHDDGRQGRGRQHPGAHPAAGRQAVAAPEADEDRGDVVRPHRAGPPVRLDRLGGQGDVRPDGRRERRVRGELEGRERHVLGTQHAVVFTSTATVCRGEWDMDIKQSGKSGTTHSAGVGGVVG